MCIRDRLRAALARFGFGASWVGAFALGTIGAFLAFDWPPLFRDVLLRLLEIGFLPGERVRVVARGFPAGDPMAVRVGNTTFALRAHEASLIRVSKTGAPAKVAP